MITLKNLTAYIPEEKRLGEVLYLQDEKGRDWYDMHSEFKADTWKILINDEGYVGAASKDPTIWNPEGLTIVEVISLPRNYFEQGPWIYRNGKFEKYQTTEFYKRDKLRGDLTEKMTTNKDLFEHLRIEKEYSELSDEKAAQLKAAAKAYLEAKAALEELDKADAS